MIRNAELLAEIAASKERLRLNPVLTPSQALTPRLAVLMTKLVDGYAKRANWRGYSYVDDMRAEAMMNLARYWKYFDPSKSKNPFAYFTQIAKTAFLDVIARETKQRDIRDELLIAKGANPSTARQIADAEQDE